MRIDLFEDASWKKASELIEEKYGKKLTYRAIKLAEADAADGFYAQGEDLIIPLKIRNINLGDVIVGSGTQLTSQQKSEVADLVKFLVEPKLYNMKLIQTESSLEKADQALKLVRSDIHLVDFENEVAPAAQTLSQIILLKSHLELSRHKVALKIHEMTGRNLFVHLDDIQASLNSKEDLENLNDITIYVPDVERLSDATLELLKNTLISTNQGPLFLIGSSLTMEAIQQKKWPEALKKDLSGFYFDIDRVPISQQTSEEILELLFFSLDSTLS